MLKKNTVKPEVSNFKFYCQPTIIFVFCLFVFAFANSCSTPTKYQSEALQNASPVPNDDATVTLQTENVNNKDVSLEEIVAIGIQKALKLAPQIADEISSHYWFTLPESIPWWASEPVAYEMGDRAQGALRLQFHKQNYKVQGRVSDELGLLWRQGKITGGPDSSFGWASKAGIAIGEEYSESGACLIDGHQCQVYVHHRRPNAGNIVWRIWYDDNADLTYALVVPEQEPAVGLAFEQDFHGTTD